MTKVDFRRKKYLTMSFSQLLTNFSYVVFSYLHVNSDDITFASTAFGKHLYNLIDNLKEFFLFSSHTIKCFQNCSIPKHQRSDCTSKMLAKKHVKKLICTRLSFFFFKKMNAVKCSPSLFLEKKKRNSGRWIRKIAFFCHRSASPGMSIAGTECDMYTVTVMAIV